jgi:hypothetical protein
MGQVVEKIKEVWTNIIDFCTYDMFGLRRLFEKITGTWDYLVFLWKNDIYREWDFWYLYQLMQFKLERMAIQLKEDDFVEDSETRYEEILKALAFLHIYEHIEDGDYDRGNVDSVREMYKQQQDAWNGFHDTLKENAQKWWS